MDVVGFSIPSATSVLFTVKLLPTVIPFAFASRTFTVPEPLTFAFASAITVSTVAPLFTYTLEPSASFVISTVLMSLFTSTAAVPSNTSLSAATDSFTVLSVSRFFVIVIVPTEPLKLSSLNVDNALISTEGIFVSPVNTTSAPSFSTISLPFRVTPSSVNASAAPPRTTILPFTVVFFTVTLPSVRAASMIRLPSIV